MAHFQHTCNACLKPICEGDVYITRCGHRFCERPRDHDVLRIDLEGQTTFTYKKYGGDRGCLITAYQEEWGLSAGEAVMQLVTPFKW